MVHFTIRVAYSLAEILDLKREAESSALCEISQLQSSFSARARLRAQKMAEFLVDEKGKIDRHRLEILDKLFEERGFIHYPEATNDADLTLYAKRVLKTLLKDKALLQSIQRAGLPLCNPLATEYVADSMGSSNVTDAILRRALLSALLTPLRQTVGSCFATAPAILIQEELPHYLMQDLLQILNTGQLTRTFGGQEYAVPMSPTAGSGELKKLVPRERILFSPGLQSALKSRQGYPEDHADAVLNAIFDGEELRRARMRFVAFADHPLLKMWEFTLASFSEIKMDFSRWNLYVSLGFDPHEEGGIGALIHRHLERRLQEENEELQKYQEESIISMQQVQATERLLQQARSEEEGRRLLAEHQARLYQMHACFEKRDQHYANAENLAQFFSFLLKQYDVLFPLHFQEIYDADMSDVTDLSTDDSPAGFRLVYKHGRSQTGSWNFIKTAKDYLQALEGFFLRSESFIEENIKWKLGKKELAELTTQISHHLQTEEFLLSAFRRMAKGRGANVRIDKKTNLDALPFKPWAHVSGGTMALLLKTYFRVEKALHEEVRRVESATELCTFLIDLLKTKTMSARVMMSSPTHAFSLLAEEPLLQSASEERIFTYTWVRDRLINPQRQFYAGILLSPSEQTFLAEKFNLNVPSLPYHITPKEWRSQFPRSKELDGFLFSSLPLIRADEWKEKAKEILKAIGKQEAYKDLGTGRGYLTRSEAHSLVIEACNRTGILNERDLHGEVAKAMRILKLAPPEPLIFADTNWAKYYFAFLVSPSSEELELWLLDKIGLKGRPMEEWRQYLDGTTNEVWSVYMDRWR